jgi:23S rRNA pseudouridine955/2504/2580 synthase
MDRRLPVSLRGQTGIPAPIEVARSEEGLRLDRLLRRLLPRVPLSRIHRMIRRGEVRLSGRRASASTRVREGDEVSLPLSPGDAAALEAAPSGGGPGTGTVARQVPIIFEDEHVVAFDKPSGVPSHPGTGHPLAATVLGTLWTRAGVGTRSFRPSLVGRLDRDTSGVQLAGLSAEGLRGLEAFSRAGGIAKAYLALVRGEGLAPEGTVELPLVDRGRGRARMAVAARGATGTAGALEAGTRYRVLDLGGGASLVEVRPRTGRRHQIRAHMAHLGAPVAGDPRYGDRAWNRELARRTGLARLFLHCAKVSFAHPLTGRETRITAPLPPELRSVLGKLGLRAP